MLKIQMALIALLIGCLTFTSCDLIQPLMTPEMPEETVPEETMPPEDSGYRRHDARLRLVDERYLSRL